MNAQNIELDEAEDSHYVIVPDFVVQRAGTRNRSRHGDSVDWRDKRERSFVGFIQ
jgi:hypothetical protein